MKSQKITLRNAGVPTNSGDMDGLLVRSKHFNDLHEDVSVLHSNMNGHKLWSGTQAEYDALETDSSTLYFILSDE